MQSKPATLARVPDAYIAVHAGAGVYGQATEKGVKRVLREACARALTAVSLGNVDSTSPSLAMVETATAVLEDDPLLNAGYGSNLTLDGTVECDAAIMSAKSQGFGSVGAVSDVKNPITLARAILEYSAQKDKLGRIPPLTLVSQGASSFARHLSEASPSSENTGRRLIPQVAPPGTLVSATAYAQWEKWKSRLEDPNYQPPPLTQSPRPLDLNNILYSPPRSPGLSSPRTPFFSAFPYNHHASSSSSHSRSPPASPPPETSQTLSPSMMHSFSMPTLFTPTPMVQGSDDTSSLRDIQDTVGAAAWHPRDGAAASVSSGGLMLKLPGRVGEAAVYGAGCWARHQVDVRDSNEGASVACSVSGTGEYIMRSSLARVVGEKVLEGLLRSPSTSAGSPAAEGSDDEEEDNYDDECNDTHQILQTILEKDFWGTYDEFQGEGESNPSAGVLLLTREIEEGGRASGSPIMVCIYDANNGNRIRIYKPPQAQGATHEAGIANEVN